MRILSRKQQELNPVKFLTNPRETAMISAQRWTPQREFCNSKTINCNGTNIVAGECACSGGTWVEGITIYPAAVMGKFCINSCYYAFEHLVIAELLRMSDYG